MPSSPLWCVKHVDDTYTTKRGDYRMFFLRPGSRIAFVIGWTTVELHADAFILNPFNPNRSLFPIRFYRTLYSIWSIYCCFISDHRNLRDSVDRDKTLVNAYCSMYAWSTMHSVHNQKDMAKIEKKRETKKET